MARVLERVKAITQENPLDPTTKMGAQASKKPKREDFRLY